QQQHQQDDQNHPAEAHAGMAHAIAITPETAGEAAEQVNDDENDQNQPKRHDALLAQRERVNASLRRASKAHSWRAFQGGRVISVLPQSATPSAASHKARRAASPPRSGLF